MAHFLLCPAPYVPQQNLWSPGRAHLHSRDPHTFLLGAGVTPGSLPKKGARTPSKMGPTPPGVQGMLTLLCKGVTPHSTYFLRDRTPHPHPLAHPSSGEKKCSLLLDWDTKKGECPHALPWSLYLLTTLSTTDHVYSTSRPCQQCFLHPLWHLPPSPGEHLS